LALKEEIVKIGDREIKVRELSFRSQMKLEDMDKITLEAIYRECLSEEDFEFLSEIGRKEGKKIRDAINRVNGWVKEKEEEKGENFHTPTSLNTRESGT